MNKIKDHLTENRLREEKAYIQIKDYIIGLQNEFIMKCNYSSKQIKMKSNNKTIVKQNSLAYLLTVPTQTLKKLAGRYVDGKNIKVKPIIERLVVENVVFLIRGSKKNGVATRYNIPWETINSRIALLKRLQQNVVQIETDNARNKQKPIDKNWPRHAYNIILANAYEIDDINLRIIIDALSKHISNEEKETLLKRNSETYIEQNRRDIKKILSKLLEHSNELSLTQTQIEKIRCALSILTTEE